MDDGWTESPTAKKKLVKTGEFDPNFGIQLNFGIGNLEIFWFSVFVGLILSPTSMMIMQTGEIKKKKVFLHSPLRNNYI